MSCCERVLKVSVGLDGEIVVRKHHATNRKSMCWESKAWKSPKDWNSESPAEYVTWSLLQEGLGHTTGSVLALCPHSALRRKPQFLLRVWGGVEAGQQWPVRGSEGLTLSGKVPNGCVSAWCFQMLDSVQRHPRSTRMKSTVCAGCRSNSTVPRPDVGMGEVYPPPHSSVPELSTKIRQYFQKA